MCLTFFYLTSMNIFNILAVIFLHSDKTLTTFTKPGLKTAVYLTIKHIWTLHSALSSHVHLLVKHFFFLL